MGSNEESGCTDCFLRRSEDIANGVQVPWVFLLFIRTSFPDYIFNTKWNDHVRRATASIDYSNPFKSLVLNTLTKFVGYIAKFNKLAFCTMFYEVLVWLETHHLCVTGCGFTKRSVREWMISNKASISLRFSRVISTYRMLIWKHHTLQKHEFGHF